MGNKGLNEGLALSVEGTAFIARHEGFRNHLYDDANGYATIGYGHLVHRGRVGTNQKAEFVFGGGISELTGRRLLAKDTHLAAEAVADYVTVPLHQHEFDALVSFTFNVGVSAFLHSTLLKVVNMHGSPAAVRAALMMWCKPEALRSRRTDEANLFVNGSYLGKAPLGTP